MKLKYTFKIISTFVVIIFAVLIVFETGAKGADINNPMKTTVQSVKPIQPENKSLSYYEPVPNLQTIINSDGTISVLDTANAIVYEFSVDMKFIKTQTFKKELDLVGSFTKDKNGNYYIFYSKQVSESAFSEKNMVLVKYSPSGVKLKDFWLEAQTTDEIWSPGYSGVKVPFAWGTCKIEISGDMIAVYFARQMFKSPDGSNHQASYGFILNINTFERLTGNNALKMPSSGHSLDQFILPVNNGFLFADQGDANPRGFTFEKVTIGQSNKKILFPFKGRWGDNNTYSEMGDLAKTPDGYIFTGTYEKSTSTAGTYNDSRNLFLLTINEDLTVMSSPIWITNYTNKNTQTVISPKMVRINQAKYLLMWEVFNQTAYTTKAYAAVVDDKGKIITPALEMANVVLNNNDVLRYNPVSGYVNWAVNTGDGKVTLYSYKSSSSGTITAISNTSNTTNAINSANNTTNAINSANNTTNKIVTTFSGGSGTVKSPYQISTPEQLNAVRNNLSASYVLTKNIDLNSFNDWTPIGTYKNPFTGTFDGKNYTISNMKITNKQAINQLDKNPTNQPYLNENEIVIGLFGNVQPSDKNVKNIVNLNLSSANIDIQGFELNCNYVINIGGIVGKTTSIIDNCTFKGKINFINVDKSAFNSEYKIGGIVGRSEAEVTNCKNYGTIDVNASYILVGGICGSGDTSYCYNYGNISGYAAYGISCVGGISGAKYVHYYEKNEKGSFAKYCFNSGNINSCGWSAYAGGICGIADYVTNSLNKGNVGSIGIIDTENNVYTYIGGIVGYLSGYYIKYKTENCFNLGKEISFDVVTKSNNKDSISAGRIIGSWAGSHDLDENYSIPDTIVNGIVTTYSSSDQLNGNSASLAEINKLLKDKGLDFLK